ncbi:MAG: hypothetical protein CMK09_10020 [Ponticaulis sp.]|nr:hypothetical protein [Ponticaulis sp.]|tara:strand:+ start:22268 stop:23407 length:1140 start_codon:yes stop_codon:yes gene_type:complete
MRAKFQGNINELTTLRFPFALAIAFYHFTNYFADYEQTGLTLLEDLAFVLDFFFILSGFVMAHAYNDPDRFSYRKYILRRFFRIYPLHVLTLFSLVLIAMVGGWLGVQASNPERYQLDSIWMHLTLLHAWPADPSITFNVPSWSVSAEWFAYLLMPVCLFLARSTRVGILLIASIFLLCLWYGLTLGVTGYSYPHLEGFALVRVCVDFFLGYAIREYLRTRSLPFTRFRGASTFYLILMTSIGLVGLPPIIAILIFILFTGAAFERALSSERNGYYDNPFALKLGNTAFALYMVHMPFAIYATNAIGLVSGLHLPGPSSDLMVVGVVGFLTLGCVPVAWYAHYWIEQPLAVYAPKFVEITLGKAFTGLKSRLSKFARPS